MKEDRAFQYNLGANEALIKEYQIIYDKISAYNDPKHIVLKNLNHYKHLLEEYLNKPIKLIKDKWSDDFSGVEDEISKYLQITFKSDYLFIEFSKNIPQRVARASNADFNKKINNTSIGFLELFDLVLDINGSKNLIHSQLKFLILIIDCLKENGLLETEINKRYPDNLRYHVQLTTISETGKTKKIRQLFLTRSKIEEIFSGFKNKGVTILNGTTIHFTASLQVNKVSTLEKTLN